MHISHGYCRMDAPWILPGSSKEIPAKGYYPEDCHGAVN